MPSIDPSCGGAATPAGASSPPAAPAGGPAETPAQPRTAADYKGRLKPIWCPGCGDYGVFSALTHALAELNLDPDQTVAVSGIGCSSRMPGFLRSYGFHGVHGRALPTALGIKLGNPRLTVLVIGGDGDGLSIGAGHFPHVARRNIDITYLLIDNRTYGLTKGQTSPTTPLGIATKTSPWGVVETPVNPISFSVSLGATFVGRGYSVQTNELRNLIVRAIRHRGFSVAQIISPCVTFGKGSGYEFFNQRVKPLPADHDPQDFCRAISQSESPDGIFTGVFYETERPEYVAELQVTGAARGRELDDGAPEIDVDALIRRFS